jgi:hypothetical protein
VSTLVTPQYLVGVDLGQSNDFTGIMVVRPEQVADQPDRTYTLGHIERVPLQTRYPAIVTHVAQVVTVLRRPVALTEGAVPIRPDVTLVVDYTGVGRPVADMILDADIDADIQLVTITGGDSVTRGDGGEWRVPKRDLASVIQRLLQEHRLVMPANHPMADTPTQELTGFRVKINLRGHDSYGAGEDWRSAPHDDLVLALALACWRGEYGVAVEIC